MEGRRRGRGGTDSDDSRSSEGRVKGKKAKVSRSFSGWLSDIITGRAASPRSSSSSSSSSSYRRWCPFEQQGRGISPSLHVYFVSRHCPFFFPVPPTGLRGQHAEISDQFFKPRVPRLYTAPWETGQGHRELAQRGRGGGVSDLFVLSGWWDRIAPREGEERGEVNQGWNQAAKKIKTRNRSIWREDLAGWKCLPPPP